MNYIKQILFALMLIFSVCAHADDPVDPYQAAQERAASERAAMANDFFGWARSSTLKAMGINFDFSKPVADNLVRLSGVGDAVAGLIDSVSPYEQARETAKKLTALDSPATTLFAILSAILIAWAGLQMFIGGGWDEILDAVITITFFSLLLSTYDQTFGESLPKFFGGWADSIYSAATGNAGGSGSMASAAGALVESIFTISMKALVGMLENMVSYILLFGAITLLFTGPAIYKIAMSAVSVVAIFIIANGISAIALVIGPVMIAFGVLPWTRKLFYGWLGVITAALGTKVIMSAALPVFLFFNDKMSTAINFTAGGGFLGGAAIKQTIMLMIYAKVLTMLIDLVPGITQSIFGGVGGILKGGGNNGASDAAATTARVGLKVATKGLV